MVLIPIFLKKIQKSISGAVNKNAKWADTMSAAAFIGLIAAFLGRGIAGLGEKTEAGAEIYGDGAGVLSLVAIVSSVVYMLILQLLNKKLKWKWLDALAMPLSMLLAIVTVFLVAHFLPDVAKIEWRY